MMKKIVLGLAAAAGLAVAGIVAVAALRPGEFKVSRSAEIEAPADKVFARVNDFHACQDWSPWAKKDPAAKASFEGPASGPGATFRWAGNKEVGEGSMTIVESRPGELIRIRLEFMKPMKATNEALFTFQENPKGKRMKSTTVTWAMTGKNNLIGRIFCLFMDMDKMVGGDFEKGLASMKSLAEKS